ncbi:MAG TPA: HNH endonuclease, partial [Kofleriaceae bacterium]|nr:HNH endonuclease [Kofleriaceae bacterium]
DLCVCHRCDVQLCVRPSHLFLGTSSDNMQDMIAKGRQNFTASAVLTAERAQEMIDRFQEGGLSMPQLARVFGVCPNTVQAILRGRSWKHLRRDQSAIAAAIAAIRPGRKPKAHVHQLSHADTVQSRALGGQSP